jgi:hypothetical protein
MSTGRHSRNQIGRGWNGLQVESASCKLQALLRTHKKLVQKTKMQGSCCG